MIVEVYSSFSSFSYFRRWLRTIDSSILVALTVCFPGPLPAQCNALSEFVRLHIEDEVVVQLQSDASVSSWLLNLIHGQSEMV